MASSQTKAEASQHDIGSAVPRRPEQLAVVASLVVGDLIAVALSGVGTGILSTWLMETGGYPILSYTPVFLSAFYIAGLYPGYGLGPVELVRRYVCSLTVTHIGLWAAKVVLGRDYLTSLHVAAWLATVIIVPAGSLGLRRLLSWLPWWGERVVVLGDGDTSDSVVEALLAHREVGLVPVALLDNKPQRWGQTVYGIPVLGGLDLCCSLAREYGISHAVIALPGIQRTRFREVVGTDGLEFLRITVVGDVIPASILSLSGNNLARVQGIEPCHNPDRPVMLVLKRIVDVVLASLLLLVFLPLMAVIALVILVESGWPVFYGHPRIGRGGKAFTVWKFRTMVRDGDSVLKVYLEANPELKREWDEKRKLKHDPRVTRVGRLLRRTSLDEIPQLWNVILGEMSLVGPRPIVMEEVPKYGEAFELYCQVRPGVTGLWQVSGRSETSYHERIQLDSYYVRNWSLWLDIYILLKTIGVVVRGLGAY